MKLVTVNAQFDISDLPRVIELLTKTKQGAMKMDGCQNYDVLVDPVDEGKLKILQNWENEVAFENYRNSELFAKLISGLKPLMVAIPETLIYDAVLAV